MVGRERSIEVGEGLGRLPRLLERNAAIDERRGTGPQREDPVMARDRLSKAPEFVQLLLRASARSGSMEITLSKLATASAKRCRRMPRV